MLVGVPFGKAGEVTKDPFGICMENMRSIGMNEYAVLIEAVVSISTNMITFLNNQNSLALFGKDLSTCASCEAGAHDYYLVIHGL